MDLLESNGLYIAISAILLVAFAVAGYRNGPAFGIAVTIPIAIGLPAWLMLPIFSGVNGTIVGAGLDAKVTLGVLALSFYSFMPGATFPVRVTLCDYAMICLVVVNFASDTLHEGFKLRFLAEIFCEWYVPYMTGRLAVQNWHLLEVTCKTVTTVAVILGVTAMIEAFFRANLFETVFGLRPLEMTPRDAERWGLKRAYGPCLNPIYFGMLQLCLLGWSLLAAKNALTGNFSRIWLCAPFFAVLGILATGSRGPVIGLAGAVAAYLFFSYKQFRIPCLASLALAAALTPVLIEPAITTLEKWSGESERIEQRQLKRPDAPVFSGTRSRLLILDLYELSFKRSGLLGFGSKAVSGFPIQIPLDEKGLAMLEQVKYVDNTYVLLLLRFGYLGLGAFLAAIAFAIWQFAKIHDLYPAELAGNAAALLGATFAGVLPGMLTVWMPHDYGFALIWTLGVSSGLVAAHRLDLLEVEYDDDEE